MKSFLKQAEAGMPVKELCRKGGFSDAAFYQWRSKYGGMDVSDARRLKELESENAKLKKLLAEAHLDIHALKAVFGVKRYPAGERVTGTRGCRRLHRRRADEYRLAGHGRSAVAVEAAGQNEAR